MGVARLHPDRQHSAREPTVHVCTACAYKLCERGRPGTTVAGKGHPLHASILP